MEKDRINKTRKSVMIKPPILYIDRREGRISGLTSKRSRWESPSRSVFLQSGRGRGITWFKETAFIRVLMPDKIANQLKEEVIDE